MAQQEQFRELELEVSADLVRQCPGLSIDVGGSVAKIVYRDQEDWLQLEKNKDAKSGKLRLLACSRTELTEAINRVKERAFITRMPDGSPTEIYTCGVGCYQFGQRINKLLNVKLTNVIEIDCFVKGFIYLAGRYSFKTLIKPVCQDVIDELKERHEKTVKMMKDFEGMSAMKFDTTNEEKEEVKEEKKEEKAADVYAIDKPMTEVLGEDMYPCTLAMLGSGFAFMTVQADGGFGIGDGSQRGGRTLLGLGSLLLNAKSYDEIIDLAEKGDMYKVTTSQKGFQKECAPDPSESSEEGTDVYGAFLSDDDMPDQSTFVFGNAVGKNLADFRREDLAAALVDMSVSDVVQLLYKSAEHEKAKRVFVCGSYYNRDYVRRKFSFVWEQINSMKVMFMPGMKPIDLHFFSHGSHLGALGALINNVENFIGKDGKVTSQESKESKQEDKTN